jgi:5-histidylcysteine sulfoxide synthase/putative 4-mercaptohistidine N1-methyltranferase
MSKERPIQRRTPILSGADAERKRIELKDYFVNTWETYESLFSLINDDTAYYLRPEPLRHPLVFYYGHTAVFFTNKLILGHYIDERLDPKLESTCAIGVDEMSWDDLNDAHYDWPAIDVIRDYRKRVKALLCQLIDTMPLDLPITQDSLAWVILMGCEHERIHLETSSVIMRMLDLDYLTSAPGWQSCSDVGNAPENRLVPQAAQSLTLGKTDQDATYGWDNEYGQQPVMVDAFETSAFLVSNQEYLAFVNAGGYRNTRYWTEEGQQWLRFSQAEMPRFWLPKNGQYMQRNLLEVIALPMNWPVEVNYLEAKAFCNWHADEQGKQVRLPTEAEWFCLRQQLAGDGSNWQKASGNIHLDYYASSCPVDRFERNGVFDVVGNVWQWTESPIDAYPGFAVHPLYDDFSTPTFDGKHNLFKGGSWISTGNESLASARYAFRRHFFQHAGFRYVVSQQAKAPVQRINPFVTELDVCEQLEAHYGPSCLGKGNYLQECVEKLLPHLSKGRHRALDVGCSVGRASFELARYFEHVDGVDFSARFIQHGVALQQNGLLRYTAKLEGELLEFRELTSAQLGHDPVKEKVSLMQGDACNLKSIYCDYDLVLALNLIECLYQPKRFLEQIGERIRSNGLLALSSNYAWAQAACESAHWIAGMKRDGENVTGMDALRELLSAQFELVTIYEVDRVQRQDQRNYHYSQNQLSLWKRI